MILVAIKTASAALSPTPPLKKARSARTTQHQPTPDRNIGERPLRADFVAKVGCWRWAVGHFVRERPILIR
jgi:hypothetical protein